MQVTIDLPDALADRVNADGRGLADLIARALQPRPLQISALRRELISFLARGPRPEQIVTFKPSDAAAERMRELLERNRAGTLTSADEAEMNEIEEIDTLVSLLKAEARRNFQHICVR